VSAQHTAIAPMQGHRPGMPPVPAGMIPAGVSVDGLTFTPYTIFGQDMGASNAGAPPPQPQPTGSTAGPSPPPRVQPEGAPPPPWQGTTGIAPSQTHLNPPPPPPPNQEQLIHRPPSQWDGYSHNGHSSGPIPGQSTGESYEYRYRDDGNSNGQWVGAHSYYDPAVCRSLKSTFSLANSLVKVCSRLSTSLSYGSP
jgi:hypothetical protein